MATYPIEVGFLYPLQIALHIGDGAHTTPEVESGGEEVKDHFGQKEEKSSEKSSPQKLHLLIPRDMDFGLLNEAAQSLKSH